MTRKASDHASLTFHALAFVPLGGRTDEPTISAASLLRPAWATFARSTFHSAAVTPIAEDGPLIGALTNSTNIALGLQRFATLHGSISGFLRTIRRPLEELLPSDVEEPADLETLVALPSAPMELLRGALGLMARPFAEAHSKVLSPFETRVLREFVPRWGEVCVEAPGLRAFEIRVSATLGPAGRLFGNTVFVGTSTLPNEPGEPDSNTPLAISIHEAAVATSHAALRKAGISSDWATVERVALDAAEQAFLASTVEPVLTNWRKSLHLGNLAKRTAELSECALTAANALRFCR